MPHSVSPKADSHNDTNNAAEAIMADAPIPNDNSQQNADNDVAMTEANAADVPATDGEEKKEVKLEDLFADAADAESDEEFPSSRPVKDYFSSSPEAPDLPR